MPPQAELRRAMVVSEGILSDNPTAKSPVNELDDDDDDGDNV